jgi:hypothetical protein
MRNQNTKPYDGPFPRPRHSHRCQACECAVYCYKSQCTKPQSEVECSSCAWHSRRAAAAAPGVVSAPAPEVREIAQWYTLIPESQRQTIFSALSESQRKQAFQYGLAVSWQILPQYARDLVTAEWWNGQPSRNAAAPAVVPAPAAVVPAFTLQAPGAPAPAQLSLFGGAE